MIDTCAVLLDLFNIVFNVVLKTINIHTLSQLHISHFHIPHTYTDFNILF